MIIIGNPETLEKFNDWKEVIEYCKENRCMTGAKYPRDEQKNDLRVSEETLSTISSYSQKHKKQENLKNYDLSVSEFKTSQSSLSTELNVETQQQQHKQNQQDSSNKTRNHHRRRYGKGFGKNRPPFTRNQINEIKNNENLDNISLNSNNLEENVAKWLEKTAKFREEHSKKNQNNNDKNDTSVQKENNEIRYLRESTKSVSIEKDVDYAEKSLALLTMQVKPSTATISSTIIRRTETKPVAVDFNKTQEHKIATPSSSSQTNLSQQAVKPSNVVYPMNFNHSKTQEPQDKKEKIASSRITVKPSAPPLSLSSKSTSNYEPFRGYGRPSLYTEVYAEKPVTSLYPTLPSSSSLSYNYSSRVDRTSQLKEQKDSKSKCLIS